MVRILPIVMLLVLVSSLSGGPAAAFETWCADDPIVAIGEHFLDIQVQMPVDKVAAMRSTTLSVVIPQNVVGTVVLNGVSAFPMETVITSRGPKWDGTGPVPVTIIVDVTASTDYPIRVVATPLLDPTTPAGGSMTATGTANSRLKVDLLLGT